MFQFADDMSYGRPIDRVSSQPERLVVTKPGQLNRSPCRHEGLLTQHLADSSAAAYFRLFPSFSNGSNGAASSY